MNNSKIVENRWAAVVKKILFSASFFILWSVLALISSIFQPLSTLKSSLSGSMSSITLADSLYQEIIQSYFSLFTISILVIFLLAGFLGYYLSRHISGRLFHFHKNQNPLNLLMNRLFSATPKTIMDFSDNDTINSFSESGSQIYGPVKILIQNGAAVFISKGMGDCRSLISNGSTPIQISPQERLIGILPSKQNEIIVDLGNPTSFDFFKSIRMRYSFHFQDQEENSDHVCSQFLLSNTQSFWKELVNSIIRLEFNSLIKMEAASTFDLASSDEQGKSGVREKEEMHSPPHSIYFSVKPMIKSKITRNRKRGVYPLAASDPEFKDDLELDIAAKEKLHRFMKKFLENLNQTTILLFGFNPIRIINYEIGEEK